MDLLNNRSISSACAKFWVEWVIVFMSKLTEALRRLFITGCVLTRTTELAANRLGADFFLPALFVLRYSSMGGLDPKQFAEQLNGIKSFKDEAWCGYWNAIAREQLVTAEMFAPSISEAFIEKSAVGQNDWVEPDWATFRAALFPLGKQVVKWMNLNSAASPSTAELDASAAQAVAALRCLVKAITYYQVSAFPGNTAARMKAYEQSRKIFHHVTQIVAPLIDMAIEPLEIPIAGDIVKGYLATPNGAKASPLAIVTNGLEGTVQELAIPLLKHHDSGLAVFFMEMPGTYAYQARMTPMSEAIYHGVIECLAKHPKVDAQHMGFVGVSFGGYWAARMAATSQRLKCVVACGAPTHHSFQIGNTIGIPDIIVKALQHTTGATSLHGLMQALRGMSLRSFYQQIKCPLLVINGDNDTLLSTRDSVDLASKAQHGTLKLYPGDDHCAMGHYNEWLDLSQSWMRTHLLTSPP